MEQFTYELIGVIRESNRISIFGKQLLENRKLIWNLKARMAYSE